LKTIYLSLGSNVGDRERNLHSAIQRLAPDVRVLRVSPVYATEPLDYTAQRWFLNLVVEAETGLFPLQLLSRIHKIERALGRVRTIPKGPRTIDIDILFHGNTVMRTPTLEIPHPRIPERRFVLVPLADLAPAFRHPVTRQTVRELLDAATPQSIRRFADCVRPTVTV
jgi:2-amino-4-hydroxy-6-hydroxymethyldihydropteridine diphosphokinase